MKTTVELSDAILRQAKEYAARHGMSLRDVFEQGLQAVLRKTPPANQQFRMKSITTKGEGLVCEEDWHTIRSMIYEGHGG